MERHPLQRGIDRRQCQAEEGTSALAKRLLNAVSDAVIVVFRLNDGDGDIGLVVEDVVARLSPFLLADAVDIGKMRSDLPFLERLGDELTRPVIPQSAAIDYTPSQYLCEFIKRCGYQGVIYRSSVSNGMNLALFEPARARCGAVNQYRVTRVSVDLIAAP